MTSRRVFLKEGAFALVSLGFAPSFLARTAFAQGRTGRPKQLIAIFQRGAVDGLNMVVPFGEPRLLPRKAEHLHRQAECRRRRGHRPRWVLRFQSPPQVPEPLWDSRQLAIVHASGSPDSTRSHFDAQDYMETATPGVKNTNDGWLNRYLQARRADETTPFRAVSLTTQLPRLLQGTSPALALSQIDQFGIRAGQANESVKASFESLYASAADRVLNGTGREAFDAIHSLKTADPTQYQPARGADYPRSAFGQALKQVAQLIKADVGVEVAFADIGGWDTHINQGAAQGQLAARLDDFARSLAALTIDLGDRLEDTVVLTMSEFGRAVGENGNRGTDHGHGNAMLVMGGGVAGGRVYGKWPGLAPAQRFEGRDLAITTDFRDVFGEIVVRHLGVKDPKPIFPGYDVRSSRFPGLLT